jgi:hypothetical protein
MLLFHNKQEVENGRELGCFCLLNPDGHVTVWPCFVSIARGSIRQ